MSLVDRIVAATRGSRNPSQVVQGINERQGSQNQLLDAQMRAIQTNGGLRERAMAGDPTAVTAYRQQGGLFGQGINAQDNMASTQKLRGLDANYQASVLEKAIQGGDIDAVKGITGQDISQNSGGTWSIGAPLTGYGSATAQGALQRVGARTSPLFAETQTKEGLFEDRRQRSLADRRLDAQVAFQNNLDLTRAAAGSKPQKQTPLEKEKSDMKKALVKRGDSPEKIKKFMDEMYPDPNMPQGIDPEENDKGGFWTSLFG